VCSQLSIKRGATGFTNRNDKLSGAIMKLKSLQTKLQQLAGRFFFLSATIALLFGSLSQAQTTYGAGGYVPNAIAPGTPASSYNLTNLFVINYFTGNLNFNLQLLTVGGRGEATMPIGTVMDSNRYIQDTYGPSAWCPTQGTSCHVYYVNQMGLSSDQGPVSFFGVYNQGGWMEAKYGDNVMQGVNSNAYAVTRLYFYRPDGTATELVDTNYYGPTGSYAMQRLWRLSNSRLPKHD
jgi:hypothetical protein